MWHWKEGNSAKYINTKGEEITTNNGFDYLVTYIKTGENSEGAATGVLKLWGNRSPKKGALVTAKGVFSGNSNFDDMASIPNGNYIMKLGKRGADGPERLNSETNPTNPMYYDGIQKIPDDATYQYQGRSFTMTPNVTNAYGNGRIRLNQTDVNLNPIAIQNQVAGYYLHGKKDFHNFTHGCVCDKSEVLFNYLWNSKIRTNVPFYVF